MSDKFHDEIGALRADVLELGRLGREMLGKSVEAMVEQNPEKARWVKAQKAELVRKHDAIEDRIFMIIALYQPVARDMRTVVCSLRMIVDLDRIGRYGKDISKIVGFIRGKPPVRNMANIPHMAELVTAMIDDALKAFENDDLSLLEEFGKRDDAVDALNKSVIRECLTYMMEDPRTITPCMDYIMAARFLERCGDHACDMAEKIYYMVRGERIEIK
jgi:phosphate transport system protein